LHNVLFLYNTNIAVQTKLSNNDGFCDKKRAKRVRALRSSIIMSYVPDVTSPVLTVATPSLLIVILPNMPDMSLGKPVGNKFDPTELQLLLSVILLFGFSAL
jgi:hypothetical protein